MRWFVLKQGRINQRFGYYEIIWHRASGYFHLRKEADKEMKRLKKKHPKTKYKVGGEKRKS